MEATYSNWRTISVVKPSGIPPVTYQTKITKTKVIPLYRMADPKGETDDVFVLYTDSYCNKAKRYTKHGVYPCTSLMPVEDMKLDLIDDQMTLDMVHNCEAIGVEVHDGDKEVGWKSFTPTVRNPPAIAIDNLAKYFVKSEKESKTEEETVEVSQVSVSEPKEAQETPEVQEAIVPAMVEKIEVMEEKRVSKKVDVSTDNILENEPAHHYVPQPKGQKGRPRKVYDDPAFDALYRSIPKLIKCTGCGKEINITNPLIYIDKARRSGIDVSKLMANFHCRSCS